MQNYQVLAAHAGTGDSRAKNTEGKIENLNSEVIATIAKAIPMDPEIISVNSTFEQLGIDSLDVVNIAFRLEDTFSIKIPDEFSLSSLEDVKGVTRTVELLLDR